MGVEVRASKSLHRPGIYKFLWGGNVNCQNLPPAGSDFALRATQGQSQLLAVPIASPKTLVIERGKAPFLFSYKIFMYMCYVKKVFSICIVNI